jgi:hypothetical protein
MRNACLFALIAIGLAAPAAAEEPAKPKKEKKICRRDVNTETILPRSICRTRSEWSQVDAAKQKQANRDTDAMRNGSGGGGVGADSN